MSFKSSLHKNYADEHLQNGEIDDYIKANSNSRTLSSSEDPSLFVRQSTSERLSPAVQDMVLEDIEKLGNCVYLKIPLDLGL